VDQLFFFFFFFFFFCENRFLVIHSLSYSVNQIFSFSLKGSSKENNAQCLILFFYLPRTMFISRLREHVFKSWLPIKCQERQKTERYCEKYYINIERKSEKSRARIYVCVLFSTKENYWKNENEPGKKV
jgi:hypothetical protein